MSNEIKVDRRTLILLVLTGFFVTNAVVAELIGVKLFTWGGFTQSVGIILWPVVFLTTDLLNEFYGKRVVRTLSVMTAVLVTYAFLVITVAIAVPAVDFSPVDYDTFQRVFGQSQWIIVGSILAFLVAQLVDVFVFFFIRQRTGHKMIWLRATGSTVVSQLIDTYIVQGVAFYIPGSLTFDQYMGVAFQGYLFKLIVAVSLTPLIYLGHSVLAPYFRSENDPVLLK